MKMAWKAFLLAAAVAAGSSVSAEMPGLASAGEHMVTAEAARGPVSGKYPVWKGGTALQRARINSAIEAELARYYDHTVKLNTHPEWPVTGTLGWSMGQEGKDGVVSFVIYESTYFHKAAHPNTYVKGMTFDAKGYRIHRDQVLSMTSDDTAEEVRARIASEAAERGIPLFPESYGRPDAWPEDFYIGRDGKLYFIFQQYDIGPYSSGWIAIEPTPSAQ